MPADWFLKVGQHAVGPVSAQQLKAMADEGKIAPTDSVRRGEDGNWVAARRVQGLFKDATPSRGSDSSPPKGGDTQGGDTQGGDPQGGEMPPQTEQSPPQATEAPPAQTPSPSVVSPDVPTAEPVAPQAPLPGAFPIDTGGDSPSSRITARHARSSSDAEDSEGRPRPRKKKSQATVSLFLGGFLLFLMVVAAVMIFFPRGSGQEAASGSSEAAEPSAETPPVEAEEASLDDLGEVLSMGTGEPSDGAEAADPMVDMVSAESLGAVLADEWTDASESAAVGGDVSVKITAAKITRPKLIRRASGRAARPKSAYLVLNLELVNGHATESRRYASWTSNATGVTLVDNLGKSYALKSFVSQGAEFDGQVKGGQGVLDPDKAVGDVLAFDRPAAEVKHLRLELPARAFGATGSLKFEIPGSMVVVAEDDAADPKVVQTDENVGPGREVPAIARGIEALDAAEKPSEAAADDMDADAMGDDGGQVAIPGLAGEESDDVGEFADDPKLQKARDELREQQDRQKKAKRSGPRKKD